MQIQNSDSSTAVKNLFLNADCMDKEVGMPSYPDKHFDLAIVDPPYGIGADNFRNGEGSKAQIGNATAPKLKKNRLNSGSGKLKDRFLNKSDCSWDNPPTQEYFNELFRVSKNQIVWGGNYFNLGTTRGIICWDKEQPWENFSAWEMGWTSFDVPASIFRYRNNGFADIQDVRIHPTQKPVKLYKWLLSKYAKPNDKILDTHTGSASSLIACEDMGFSYTAYELDKDYYQSAQKRLKQFRSQLKLEI